MRESAAAGSTLLRGIALRHALFQLVAACVFVAWHACVFDAFGTRPSADAMDPVRARLPVDSHDKIFCQRAGPEAETPDRIARMPQRTVRHACAPADHFEMVSSAMPFVRGPINPIAAITITIAPAMNANTPNVPKPRSTAAITNDEKIAEKRLHE